MRDVVVVPRMREDRANDREPLDLEAETRRRIDMLVARTKAWRNGSFQTPAEPHPGIEAAAS
jgi:hypothetical protein